MNKKQKWLTLISVLIFLFVTLNPMVFRLRPNRFNASPYFTIWPIYRYWGVIVVPFFALFYYFKDEDKKDEKPDNEQ